MGSQTSSNQIIPVRRIVAACVGLGASACLFNLDYLQNRECGAGLQLCGDHCAASCLSDAGTPGEGGAKADANADAESHPNADGGDSSTEEAGPGDSGSTDGASPEAGLPGVVWRAFLPLANETSGVSPDVSGNDYNMSVSSDILFGSQHMIMTTTTAAAQIPPKNSVPVLPLDGSYSVSVWVTLYTDPAAATWTYLTILSADGTEVSEFYLQTRGDHGGAFAFGMPQNDSNGGAQVSGGLCVAVSKVVPTLTVLYHLVATRDAVGGLNTIYVNGTSSGGAACSSSAGYGWPTAAGTLDVGRGMYSGKAGDFWSGTMAGLGVIDRVLTPEEVAALYALGPTYSP